MDTIVMEGTPVLYPNVAGADAAVIKLKFLADSAYLAKYHGRIKAENGHHHVYVEHQPNLLTYLRKQKTRKVSASCIMSDPRFHRVATWITKLFGDFLRGLNSMHTRGFVHGSISIENLFVIEFEDGSVHGKIGNLSTAKYYLPDNKGRKTYKGSLGPVGLYAVGVKSDLMALGSIIYEALIGVHIPFNAEMQYMFEDDCCMDEKFNRFPELYHLLTNIQDDTLAQANQILQHPFFWNSSKRINFFKDISDRVALYRLPGDDTDPEGNQNLHQPFVRDSSKKNEFLKDINDWVGNQILHHPFFWDSTKKSEFLKDMKDINDWVDLCCRLPRDDLHPLPLPPLPPHIAAMQDNAEKLKTELDKSLAPDYKGWKRWIDEAHLSEFAGCSDKLPTSLLHAIRNKLSHRQEIPLSFYDEAEGIVGRENVLELFFSYYFPNFLIGVYDLAKPFLHEDKFFQNYYQNE